MRNVPGLATPKQPAFHQRQGDGQDWRVQIFRYTNYPPAVDSELLWKRYLYQLRHRNGSLCPQQQPKLLLQGGNLRFNPKLLFCQHHYTGCQAD